MPKNLKSFVSLILCFIMLGSCFPGSFVFASDERAQRTVYLHAQGENPSGKTDVSTVYLGDETDVYFAVDKPNKGEVKDGVHTQPQYDLNGYTVTIYFDEDYFSLKDETAPIDYTLPQKDLPTGSASKGYYVYRHGSGEKVIDGKTYKSAYITVFFSGVYIPEKEGEWYDLCKLPLTPKRTGSTQVFFDVSGTDGESVELFAKDVSGELDAQSFECFPVNAGVHNITIKSQPRPSAPRAEPSAGSYTEKQTVTLKCADGCEIYYSTDGVNFDKYSSPFEVAETTTVVCYAVRISDGRKSSEVSYTYKIVPNPPYLFVDKNGEKTLIPNVYSEYSAFSVYVSDKSVFGNIDDASEVYYTFSNASAQEPEIGGNPETQWVKIDKKSLKINILKKCTLRLITQKKGEFSDVSEYYLSVKPSRVSADVPSGEYDGKIDVSLKCETSGAKIFYTLNGADPVTGGSEFFGTLTVAKDATLRAVAYYDGTFGEISSYYYIFKSHDDYGIDAFYPSGVYEGSVNVTLTANNPENSIEYSTDGKNTWQKYDGTLVFDKDTILYARAADKDGVRHTDVEFTYKIKPLPPRFAPESTQFTNAKSITVYCEESVNNLTESTTERYDLFYTLDGTDPISSESRIKADESSDSADIEITKYTVVKAVVLKDKTTYSNVVTHSYDIVIKKPTRPAMTLTPGRYVRKIDSETGFFTQFIPVSGGTQIYYTIGYNGGFLPDPVPGGADTLKYDGEPIEVKGETVIKAVAVNIFGVKSDIGIFSYTVVPEAPRCAPSASVSGDRLPVVPVSAVAGSTVKYSINGFENEFLCENKNFYIDTQTGGAYLDKDCTMPINDKKTDISSPAVVEIMSELDSVSSETNRYTYSLSNGDVLAPPFADRETGEYEEIKIDDENNLLYVKLYSLNSGDVIKYKLDNAPQWTDYDGGEIKLDTDTVLQIISEKDGKQSASASYVYNFVPLAPIITLPSGRYLKSDSPTTKIELDKRAPDKNYTIWYRANGDKQDYRYTGNFEREINKTMSFKAYAVNEETGKKSKNTIHYYIIESDGALTGNVYVASPFDVPRISADVLSEGEYAKGIKLLTQRSGAEIHYSYSYEQIGSDDMVSKGEFVYDNTPITVNPAMTKIKITAHLEENGVKISGSEETFEIEFVHLNVPETSLGYDKTEFAKGTEYTLVNAYPNDENILIYYTLDGTDAKNGKIYNGEKFALSQKTTVKAVYMSACSKCGKCKDGKKDECLYKVYGKTGTYMYTVPSTAGGGGGGGGTRTVDNTRKYTSDIFGNESPTHIGYIKGYPDGSVKPDGDITREEMTAVLYRITNHEYEKPFAATGEVFGDIDLDRWSARDIEYMAEKGIAKGYPDGLFKPSNPLTRAEFAALICRFAKFEYDDNSQNPFPDLDKTHWAYNDILSLNSAKLMTGYEDGTFRAQSNITRAEVMTVINKILGRNPSDEYVKTLGYNPYNDLEKDKWYYVAVLEATVTHNYYLGKNGVEIKWEDCK